LEVLQEEEEEEELICIYHQLALEVFLYRPMLTKQWFRMCLVEKEKELNLKMG
jgi:hypothetical protein